MADIFLDPGLLDLVRLRVVQIHGCKCCTRQYSNEMKAKGKIDQRLHLLKSWRTETVFSLREKAALNLAEAVTFNPISSIPREAIYAANPFFTEEQMILFVLEIVAVNDWHFLKSFQHENMTGRPTRNAKQVEEMMAAPDFRLSEVEIAEVEEEQTVKA